MNHETWGLGVAVLLATAGGCYTGGAVDTSSPPPAKPASTVVEGTEPPTGPAVTGVPCDVAEVLARACATCHGEPLSGGAPNSMIRYEDLAAPSRSSPTETVAELSLARMNDPEKPMPPTGATAEDVAVLDAWVAGGMLPGTCSASFTAGTGDAEYATPTVCTSQKEWTRGDRGAFAMHPGVACINCHTQDRGPRYSAAGTVYTTAHEPDDCNGVPDKSVTVVITDAKGKVTSMPVTAAGNFAMSTRITAPYHAKVVSGTKVRAMNTAQTVGDCNSCHTEQGDSTTNTPGRIMAPTADEP